MKKSRIFIVMFMFLIILTGCSKKDEECTHENVTWVIDSAATCLDDGIKHQECEKCKKIISIGKVEKIGHDIINHEKVDATCLESGYNAYDTCSRCSYTTYQTINALGHDIINHEKKEATCTVLGYEAYDSCSRCDYISSYKPIEALGHIESEWLTDVEATCTTNGTKHIECKTCNTILKLEPITKLGHDIINHEKVDATCLESGYDSYDTCSRCSYTTYQIINAIGHTESEWLTDLEPTCTTNGTKHIECKTCNKILKLEPITKLGHDIINHEKKEATCTVLGYEAYDSCSRCDYISSYKPIAALGHIESEWLTDLEPTCTTNGTKHMECLTCKEIVVTKSIEKLGHVKVETITWPTCLNDGYKTINCKACNKKVEETPLEPGFPYKGTTNEEKKQAMINDYLNDITEYLEGAGNPTFGTSEGKKAVALSDLYPAGALNYELAGNNTSTFYGTAKYRTKWSWMINYVMGVRAASGLSTAHFETVVNAGTCGSPFTLNAEIYNFFVNDHRTSWPASSNYKLKDDEGNPTLDNAYGFINNYKFHHISISVIEPTCTKDGTVYIECLTCKEIVETKSIEKIEHFVQNEYDSHISATCYSEGYSAYGVCEICNCLVYNIIPKKSHDKVETIIWPTCSSDGYKAIVCKYCNKIFEKTPLEPGFPYKGTTNEEKKQAMINDYLNDITEYLEGAGNTTFGTSEGKKAVALSDLYPAGALNWELADKTTSTFYGTAIYRTKWSWMLNYIMSVRESSGLSTTHFEDIIYRGFCGSPATVNSEIYNFFVNDHRTSWPASSNYKLKDDEGNPTLDNAYGFINNYKFHHISISVTEPSCLEEGLKTVKCDECDEIFNSNVLEKNGHTFSENECIYCKTKMSEVSNLVGNYIYFGEYPQSIKDENVTITSDTPDDNGYYLGSDGERYAKQKAILRNGTDFVSISTVLIKNEFYYFKVEPIKWKILESDNGTYKLVTDLIIDIKEFNASNEDRIIDGQTIYSNNYEYSDIRKWLNDEFYNKAFNEELQLKINTTLVDNSLASTGYTENPYICNDTYDKVYLLSKSDVYNELYGFINNEDRQKVVSDYTIAKGCGGVYAYYYQEEKFKWVDTWYLRSPDTQDRNGTMDVYINGSLSNVPSSFYRGVVPSITITL